MIKRKYYSVRTGKVTDEKVDLDTFKRIFLMVYRQLSHDGYFQNYFGIDCTDGYLPGRLGEDIESIMFINLKKERLYPIERYINNYSEDDLFDVIEFLHDHCSAGLDGGHHSWNNCGYHYYTFNDEMGKDHFREVVNPILKEYKDGYEISVDGEILINSENGLSNLFNAEIPTQDFENIQNKMDNAILKFRRHRSTLDDRKEAIRELADVMEFLRPEIKEHLDRKDESDLFNIVNNFGIRHHNKAQKVDYNKAVWYSWMFYYYLATIHTILRITKKN
ncbi:hypothetical protein LRS05_12305 [Flavobacterium sp. J372]|uniref:hypothetical protein n=1 Tax=Flavobacterium sp. J372 TaxID=2898436 RepID=UPI0021517822|nr:hypothetical protein [Flavobacterium sp. J372]MCR5862864.1 hypothetical protein [Flavobacterium sp. J372]